MSLTPTTGGGTESRERELPRASSRPGGARTGGWIAASPLVERHTWSRIKTLFFTDGRVAFPGWWIGTLLERSSRCADCFPADAVGAVLSLDGFRQRWFRIMTRCDASCACMRRGCRIVRHPTPRISTSQAETTHDRDSRVAIRCSSAFVYFWYRSILSFAFIRSMFKRTLSR